jgi:retinol-binding protein 3
MSEKLYAFLFRLFPSRFRQSYGEDALQLFRDRARHEAGFPSRFRLWLDLLADLAISVPREYFYAQPELLSACAGPTPGSPSFYFLNQGSPRPGALAFGFLLSLSALLTFSNLLNQGGQPRTLRAPASRRQSFSSHPSKTAPSPSPAADDSSFSLTGEATEQATDSASASHRSASCCAPSGQDSSISSTPPAAAGDSSSDSKKNAPASAAPVSVVAAKTQLTASDRHRVIDAAASNLTQYYVDRGLARRMADALHTHERRGDDDSATDGPAFAALVTGQMRDVSHDLHLDFVYSAEPLPEPSPALASEPSLGYRDFLQRNNCTFEKIRLFPHNIGYLKLNSFPNPSVCESTAKSALRQLNNADAILFDLRDNRGGDPAMVMFLAAYLFDHPEYMYSPRENTSQRSWTGSPIPGNNLADKPVYILTSHITASAAEHFSYDLKMLKRATLVGETTGGAAHSGVFHRLDDHFGIGIPESRPINPYGPNDWAVVGITPNVQVPAAEALITAQRLALAKLNMRRTPTRGR